MQIKKIIKIIATAGVLALLAFNGYWFGWKEMKERAYKQGFRTAQVQINNLIVQQLNDTGQLRVTIPQKDGKVKTIILVPQKEVSNKNENHK